MLRAVRQTLDWAALYRLPQPCILAIRGQGSSRPDPTHSGFPLAIGDGDPSVVIASWTAVLCLAAAITLRIRLKALKTQPRAYRVIEAAHVLLTAIGFTSSTVSAVIIVGVSSGVASFMFGGVALLAGYYWFTTNRDLRDALRSQDA